MAEKEKRRGDVGRGEREGAGIFESKPVLEDWLLWTPRSTCRP